MKLLAPEGPAPWAPAPVLPARVLIATDAVATRNGVGAYYQDLAEHLQGRIEHVEVVSPDPSATIWRGAFPMPGDRTQRIALPNPRDLARRLAVTRPNVVVLPTPGPYGLWGLRAARRTGARVLVGFHTHFEALADLYWTSPFGKLSRFYLESINRLLFRHADAILVNSEEMRRLARSSGGQKIVRVGTSIPREFLEVEPPAVRREVRSVLFAGRLAPEKNLHLVLEAAAQLPDLEFRIAGDGPLRGEVAEAARRLPNLDWLGWLDRGDLRRTLDDCCVLVLPSKVESFGTVALEALARGRTVIVSDSCGILDWPELAPALVAMRSGESLAGAVGRVCGWSFDARTARARLARDAAQRIVEANMSPWLDLLGDLAPEPVASVGS